MGAKTEISWSDATWTPLRARVKENAAEIARAKGYTSLVQIAERMAGHVGPHCEKVSTECTECYSETNNSRCLPANGTGLPFDRRSRDLVDPFVDEKILVQPLKWRKPKMIFVNSQTDTWGEWVPDESIDRLFAVALLCPDHTFQFLTKRAKRLLEWALAKKHEPNSQSTFGGIAEALWAINKADPRLARAHGVDPLAVASDLIMGQWRKWWPLQNCWLGVSAGNQEAADERIPLLLQTPAAVRFVSAEPLLGPVDFRCWLPIMTEGRFHFSDCSCLQCLDHRLSLRINTNTFLDQVIVGGESGPGARPFDIQWAYRIVAQCKQAATACFVKQLGAKPYDSEGGASPIARENAIPLSLRDRKGADPSEWPEYLRVQQFPAGAAEGR